VLAHPGAISIFLGTHNEASCLALAARMDKEKMARDDGSVTFAQLYGMSDHISFNLAKAGYRVAKYVPYGPLRSVLPYLFRRAQENSAISGQTGRELKLIDAELRRRSRVTLSLPS
jgi:proline dehydrogenase